jgi:protein-S-isoprenylcysteine O-methyltransferase Ste14
MSVDTLEWIVKVLGGLAALATFGTIVAGLFRARRRPAGRESGAVPGLLRSPFFYLLASAVYAGLCLALWLPLPVALSPAARTLSLVIGSALYFAGLSLVLWGRLTLGRMYNVSYSFDVQLYADHRLITHGPFAIVRHPMYLGILLAGLGGILLYRTWTLVYIATNFLGLLVRAKREERALAAEFGETWQAYCRRVPAVLPRISRHGG